MAAATMSAEREKESVIVRWFKNHAATADITPGCLTTKDGTRKPINRVPPWDRPFRGKVWKKLLVFSFKFSERETRMAKRPVLSLFHSKSPSPAQQGEHAEATEEGGGGFGNGIDVEHGSADDQIIETLGV